MKKLFQIFILIGFILLQNLFAQQDKLEKIDEYINTAMKDWDMPGFAIAIVKNDSVIFAKGYGIRETGKPDKVDQNTLFVIASCSKAFTTAALAILNDEGKINWDDPVTKYLPGFQMYDSWVTKEITIRDLLTHRSGLATFSGDFLWLGSAYDREEIIHRIRFLKPVSSFRTKYGYQNLMFITAAQIIKAVTDTSWGDYIQAHILNKIGMIHTNTSYEQFYKSSDAAKAHYRKDGTMKVYTDIQRDNAQGALGINSCVEDMAQWIRLQLGNGLYKNLRIFSEKLSHQMHANQFAFGNADYGFGWFITYKNGKRILNHGGGMPGYISDIDLIPEENLGFIILSNFESGMVNSVRNYIIDSMTGVEPKDYERIMLEGWNRRLERFANELKRREDERAKNTLPSMPLEKYCGTYEDKMYGDAEVSLKNGELYLQFIPTPTFKGVLHHYQYDTFYIDWEDEFLTRGFVKFDMNFKGQPDKITFEVPNSPDLIFTELLFERKNN